MSLQPVQSLDARKLREAHEQAIRDEADAKGFERGKAERFAEVSSVYQDEIERRDVLHIESDRKAEAYGYWRGFALSGIVSLLLGAAGAFWFMSMTMLNTGAVVDQATRPTWQPPELRALDEDSQPVDALPGYARPGREPADRP